MVSRVGLAGIAGLPELPPQQAKPADGFAEMLETAVQGVEKKHVDADDQLRRLASGQDVDLHGTMIALEEANITMRAMTSVRDKVVEAYQAIWNMPV